MKYEYMESHTGERRQCEWCNYPAPLRDFINPHGTDPNDKIFYCEICTGTLVTTYVDKKLGQDLAWIANHIIFEVRQK